MVFVYSSLVFGELWPNIFCKHLMFIVFLFNAYLKEIGVVIGIHKKMSHHLARRTFATTVLLFNDVPMEIVSALLGHSTMSVTQDSYAKIVNKKIESVMAVFYKGGDG